MREDSVALEEARLKGVETLDDYESVHERHRIFPAVFEGRGHLRVLDVAAGVGCVAKRIRDTHTAEVVCNDVSPTSLRVLRGMGLETMSFSIDSSSEPFPLEGGSFDAVVALATIEHLVHVDHFVREVHRILPDGGYFYVSAPNYSGLTYLLPFLASGRTFHDPMSEQSRYEFYAHVRYFTYRTLLEYVSSFGFVADAVYLGIPEGSSNYLSLYEKSRIKALVIRYSMKTIYTLLSPRWGAEPVLCFRKETAAGGDAARPRKVVL
jgi:2-polyprenyl-3-methyl-5-hydroxy-6-metoxy-1,4-benzoquinol methylase